MKRPSDRLIKWLRQYFSVTALSRDDLNYIVMAIQDNEDQLEQLRDQAGRPEEVSGGHS